MTREDSSSEETSRRPRKRRTWFYVRVSVLLAILFVVGLYAIQDYRSRNARRDWESTVDVAIVLVHVAADTPVEASAVQSLRDRTAALEDRLAVEYARHRLSATMRPFHFRVVGPVDVAEPPPTPASDGPADLAKQALALSAWLRDVDPRVGIDAKLYDSRIYVAARRPDSPEHTAVEGQSEQGGRIGMVRVELDASMVDFTFFVVTHELMHTLGATDKYGPDGRALLPIGLAEPERQPLYPQRFVEVMARNRPLSATREAIPETLDELAVGPLTAKEIGWVP